MANLTLRLSDDLKARLERHKEINWSEVARRAMTTYLDKLELADALASKSQLTEEDAEEIGEKIKAGIARRHGLIG